ncbi:hypothetical protein [Luteitalea pratensis]|uniref:hypothetical protein n=1 Tax=Luteitalea pratensis TaxID=1855912 RepID=UPI000D730BE9|nr:hypothetical protein [Luteitalea pratensis]
MAGILEAAHKTQYRVGNWRVYERALVGRDDVTLWLSPPARAAGGVPPSMAFAPAVEVVGTSRRPSPVVF